MEIKTIHLHRNRLGAYTPRLLLFLPIIVFIFAMVLMRLLLASPETASTLEPQVLGEESKPDQ